jgi:hypothetical protein
MPSADLQPDPLPPEREMPLWSAAGWLAATTMADPNAATDEMPALAELSLPTTNGQLPTLKPSLLNRMRDSDLNGLAPGEQEPDESGER